MNIFERLIAIFGVVSCGALTVVFSSFAIKAVISMWNPSCQLF